MTIAITFAGGTYGTYLEWCLTTLTSDVEVQLPFTDSGNSHLFAGNHLKNITGWERYLNSGDNFKFARMHPKTFETDSLSKNMDYICDTASSVIYLYPGRDSLLLCVNNYFSKIWVDWQSYQFNSHIDPNTIYDNWPVAHGTPIKNIDNWIMREFLSFYLMPAWMNQTEWYHIDTWSHPKCCVVTTTDLLHNFESSLQRICDHANIIPTRKISDLVPYHAHNLSLQQHLTQDQICNDIIQSVLSDTDISWNSLSLPSEAWIQWELRNRGFEIQCNGLDKFPTNSVQLRELLYQI